MVRYSHTGIEHPDEGGTDISIDIEVSASAEYEDEAEKTVMHLQDVAIATLQAWENEQPPSECDGHFMGVAWDSVFGDEDTNDSQDEEVDPFGE